MWKPIKEALAALRRWTAHHRHKRMMRWRSLAATAPCEAEARLEADAHQALRDAVCDRTAAIVRRVVPDVLTAARIPESEHHAAVVSIANAFLADIRAAPQLASDPRRALRLLDTLDERAMCDAIRNATLARVRAVQASGAMGAAFNSHRDPIPQ
jgi:hypothetical protein